MSSTMHSLLCTLLESFHHYIDWLRQVRVIFVTKAFFKMLGNEMYAMSATPYESQMGLLSKSKGNTFAYGLHLLGWICASQIVMKIGRKVYALLDVISLKVGFLVTRVICFQHLIWNSTLQTALLRLQRCPRWKSSNMQCLHVIPEAD